MKMKPLTTTLLSVVLLLGCQSEEKQVKTPLPVKVKLMTVTTETTSGESRYSGTLEEEQGTALSFSTAGTVRTIHFSLGQRIASGQLIATLDPTSMQSSYNAARASLAQAEDAYRRMKELHDKGSLPEIKWMEVQSQLEQARSLEQIAAKNLNDCKLFAPFAGVISEKNIEKGQNVMPGMPVARLVTTSGLKVKIAVPEAEIASIIQGQEAAVVIPALNGKTFTAKVTEKGIVANSMSRSYDVKLQLDGMLFGLMPGMVAEVSLQSAASNTENCIIPAHIIQLDEQNNSFVWVAENGKAHKCIIHIGKYSADGVIVLHGLSNGDRIITEGQQKVCEGMEVEL